LVPINTKAKMQNLKMTAAEITGLGATLAICQALRDLLEFTKIQKEALGAIARLKSTLGEQDTEFSAKYTNLVDIINTLYLAPESLAAQKPAVEAAVGATRDAGLKAYQTLHKRFRLDKKGDEAKAALTNSVTLKQLNKLVAVKALSRHKLQELQGRLTGLLFCSGCSDSNLLKDPLTLCPHCKFDPSAFLLHATSANEAITGCETELAALHTAWTQQLLAELKDPFVIEGLKMLKPDEFDAVNALLASSALPDPVTDIFVTALNTVLSGLTRKGVTGTALSSALFSDSTPLKPDELRARFEEWIKAQIGTETESTVRFVLEEKG
jgi:hypothetical protein